MNNFTLDFFILGLFFLLLIIFIYGTILLILLNKNFQNKIILKKIKEVYEEYKLFEYYEISTTFSLILRIFALICIFPLCIYYYSTAKFIFLFALVPAFISIFTSFTFPKNISLEKNSLILRNTFNTKRIEYKINELDYIKLKILHSRRHSNLVLCVKTIYDNNIAQHPLSFQDWLYVEILVYIIHFIKSNNTNSISELSLEDIQLLRDQYRKD